MSGENVMWVSKQMGHKDWAFTARTYARWIPEDAPQAGNLAVSKFAQMAHTQRK
jgi:integrase